MPVARRVCSGVLEASRGYSVDHSFTVYSFGWMYRGRGRGWVEVEPGVVAEVYPEKGGLGFTVYAAPWAEPSSDPARALGRVLGLWEDYTGFHRLASRDPLTRCIPSRLPGYRLRSMSPWAALVTGVAQQNTGFRQGWGMLYRFHLAAGERLQLPGRHVYILFPRPGSGVYEAARRSGFGYRASIVARLAGLAAETGEAEPGLVEAARSVKGVGDYTYKLARLLSLRDYSSLPLDRWLRSLAAEAYHVEPRQAGRAIQERFGGWAGLAALAATICLDALPLRKALERLRRGLTDPGHVEPSPVNLWRHTPPPQGEG